MSTVSLAQSGAVGGLAMAVLLGGCADPAPGTGSSTSVSTTTAPASSSAPAPSAAPVVPFPGGQPFDYQIGGGYPAATDVRVRPADPDPGCRPRDRARPGTTLRDRDVSPRGEPGFVGSRC